MWSIFLTLKIYADVNLLLFPIEMRLILKYGKSKG